jgi:alpha-galactosidase/6-phospho-beta-glucosidase family protein
MNKKIAFIGGGSVQWTPKLVTDMAVIEALDGSELILHDIDEDALNLLTRACERISTLAGDTLKIAATLDRTTALRDADFVILCVGIGGLSAMRNDLEIPEKYGVYQSVGDTVGPGGLARGLRHIPFAVHLAREMEQLCPDAWLLNVTNPMSTICRGVTRATSIRTIGLCHEVLGVRHHLAIMLDANVADITLDVGGINHLPVILRCDIAGRDGLALLREWVAEHDPYTLMDQAKLDDVFDVFIDRFAVKLILFKQLGVLFGAGDRHVAEFFSGFLTEETDYGRRYGVLLTNVDQREEMVRLRRDSVEAFVKGVPQNLERSDEQLVPVMAALVGGPPGRFVVNLPNQGQIENLPREAVVESIAEIDGSGVHPVACGLVPSEVQGLFASHVARQELIVEAALTGRREPALAALTTDPLVRDLRTVEPMLDEFLAANATYIRLDGAD